ncbi:MAG: aminopeptidase N [Chromatiales bacterium]|nr:aminopeptidase N [Chromatiales bacterium]
MPSSAPAAIRLEDYTAPAYLVDEVELRFELDPKSTVVRTRLAMRRNPQHPAGADCILDGRELRTEGVWLDGEAVGEQRVTIEPERLVLRDPPERFELSTVVRIAPADNTSLEGLYTSHGNFCTQCEAEGFRKITWYPDRPDVMARYRTTIVGDPDRYPVMLSNGNPVSRETLADGRVAVTWEDPFAKPSYLFALVAGNLACVEDTFVTRSGREVTLRIYVEPHNRDRCDHAMASLKKSMRWDEEVYGLEYDLDIFMIVAVDDFNMGAMENKGLNVFNSKYVLARPETATDLDHAAIEGVIAHEYFHNWTGNRVTCRDWFQLSLKEGLTVFRDQEFSADMTSRAVKRVQDVRLLRTHQFAEDAGPMAHPVRPDSYIEISNFYTVTIYNKGAEVIRMIHTIVGPEGFRRGMDLYIQRHDGQAVTTEDFVRAMEDANGVDLGQFRRWYTQAGTPEVTARGEHDPATATYRLTLTQRCAPTPGQPEKAPFHIPLRLALLDESGCELPLQVRDHPQLTGTEGVVHLDRPQQVVVFERIARRPVLSIGRGFSAPVRLTVERDDAERAFLMGSDTDPFNRWDAAQDYALDVMLRLIAAEQAGEQPAPPAAFVEAFGRTLTDDTLDRALVAEALALPAESYVADRMSIIDPDAIHAVRRRLRRHLAEALRDGLERGYRANRSDAPYRFDAESAGRRSFKNLCLAYLVELEAPEPRQWCLAQFRGADNMTDGLGAIGCLIGLDTPERDQALAEFETRWRDDPLVMDKWFALQAMSPRADALSEVRRLMAHPVYDPRNPNRVRSLVGAFCHGNQVRFNDASGAGYAFLTEQVLEIDPRNPQIAARLLGAFARWRKLDPARRGLVQSQLERILGTPKLSKDTYEVASKTLGPR